MNEFEVTWVVQVSANSPEDAAKRAREMQLDADSLATVFEVQQVMTQKSVAPVVVDLKIEGWWAP